MADATYFPYVYRKQGGAELVVASGGQITVETGGALSVAVQTADSTATTIAASGLTLLSGTTSGPTYLIANPLVGVMKTISLTHTSSGVTHRAIVSPASTGVSFDTTGGNQLTFATSALRGITLVGMTTSAYRIVGTYSGASIAAPRTT